MSESINAPSTTTGPKKVWSAIEMERGAMCEQSGRDILQPFVEGAFRGDDVAADSEWDLAAGYEPPPRLFVRRLFTNGKTTNTEEDVVGRQIRDLRALAQKAREAERSSTADAKGLSFQCYFRFSESRRALTAAAWKVWHERWDLAARTQDWTCFCELVGDASMIWRTGVRLRWVGALIALRRWSRVSAAQEEGQRQGRPNLILLCAHHGRTPWRF